jgi:hypothetical protein
MRDGDIIGSETLMESLNSGACKIQQIKDEHGVTQHLFTDEEGKSWDPQMPWIADDY